MKHFCLKFHPVRIPEKPDSTRIHLVFMAASHRARGKVVAWIGAVLLIMPSASVFAHAQSAGAWNKRGAEAEARQDYDAAFEAFRQAHLKKPKDLLYQTRYDRATFEASNAHLDRGRVLRQSGDMDGAITEFSRALQIDKGNQAAAQELLVSEMREVSASKSATPSAGKRSRGDVIQSSSGEQFPHQRRVARDIDALDPPVELRPVSDDTITLHMIGDTKVIYQAIGKAAGLNVIFDSEYTSKSIPVDLNSVSLADALRIVGKISGTFWSPVTPNTIFIAQNNRTKHTDLDDLAVETFYLTNVSQQSDANEVLVAIRNLLDPSVKLYLVASQNAIVIRATPDELTLAEKLINDLDRTRSEVVVDIAVLEVNRQLERNLGITLPQSFGLAPQYSNQNITNTTTGTTTTSATGTTTTGATSSLTLNTLGNLNATNFAVSVTGGQVNALLSDADTRILQNPRVRATDGQPATLKIGQKIPVATGSYSAGAGVTTASLGVQTQFTYLDVGVNIDMTPTVHNDDEVSLKLKIEVSTQQGNQPLSGVNEPIIGQRIVQQVIQLKDGEPSLLAGLVQQQDTKTVSGTPGLGELPFFKYFFSSQDKVQESDEIVFLLIPHIVRESLLTEENTRIIDTGTGQQIELRRGGPEQNREAYNDAAGSDRLDEGSSNSHATSAANAASAMIGQLAAQARTVAPPGVSSASGAGQTPSPLALAVTPQVSNQGVGSTFQVAVTASNARDLFSIPLQIHFNPKVLSLVDVDAGEFLGRDGQAAALVHRDEGNGLASLSAARPPHTVGVNGQGTLFTLAFKAIAAGDSSLSLVDIGARDSKQNSVATVEIQGTVHVK